MVSFQSIFKKNTLNEKQISEKRTGEYKTLFVNSGSVRWSSQNYETFASEGYMKNVIAHRCINLISTAASFVSLKLYKIENGQKIENADHPALKLLFQPSRLETKMDFFQSIYSYKMISGNSYIKASLSKGIPTELKVIRPDKVKVLIDNHGEVCGYSCSVRAEEKKVYINHITNKCEILHLKNFHPLNNYYGFSSVEAARYGIDQHNEASNYAKSLLQNSARPSGALVVKGVDGNGGMLTDEQFERLRDQIDDEFIGIHNTGRPMVLEGGLDWKEMSMRPRDMDFIENKNSASREIALAFGVPPQLLGLPGDSTYNNMMEARIALWEQTIIPMITDAISGISRWLSNLYMEDFVIDLDKESISALSHKREGDFDKIAKATFLTDEEKREFLGFPRTKASS